MLSFQVLKWCFYILISGLYVYAAFILRGFFGIKGPVKETVLQRIKEQNLKFKEFFITEELEQKFQSSGNPLGLNAKKFQIIRYISCLSAFGFGIYRIVEYPDLELVSKLLGLLVPFVFLGFITNPKKKSMKYLFKMYQDQNEYRMNQELFMLYSMITDELKESKDQTVNILDLLRKLRQYTPQIRSSINKGLRHPRLGVSTVMRIIGEDIGTEEALEVCKIIAELNQVGQQNLHELILNRESTYISTLRSNRQKKREKLGTFVNGIVFIPLFFYVIDVLMVIMQMISSMGSSLNNLK